MKEHLSGLATAIASAYNTLTPTIPLVAGGNLFVGRFPEAPSFSVGLLPTSVPRNPHAVTHGLEFDLAVRAPQNDAGLAATVIQSLIPLVVRASNSPGCPGVVRLIEEPAASGIDKQERMVMVTKFVIWTTKV